MRVRAVRSVFGAGLLVAALGACSGPGGSGDAGGDAAAPIDVGTVRYEQVQEIFTRSCAAFPSCHNNAGMRGDLDLSAGNSYADTVRVASTQATGMNIVEPGNPQRSFLMHKLDGTMSTLAECMGSNPLQCGTRMPMVGGEGLTEEELAILRAWIAQGAVGPTSGGGGGGSDAGSGEASAPIDAAGGG